MINVPKQYSTTPRSPEQREALNAMEELISEFFAFQAAACTAQDDCRCGASLAHHRELRGLSA